MPTLEEIKLTDEQTKLMESMIEEVFSKDTPLKQLVYFQKWTKKIWDAALQAEYKHIHHWKPKLHWCQDWDGLLIDQGDPEFEHCNCFPKK